MDETLFSPRANFEPAVAALHGAETGGSGAFSAAAADERNPGTENRGGFQQAIYPARRPAGTDQRAGLFRSRGNLCAAYGGGTDGHAAEPRRRARRGLHHDSPGIAAAQFANRVAGVERNSKRGFSGHGATADASAGPADRSASRISHHRFPGGPRLLPPLHG